MFSCNYDIISRIGSHSRELYSLQNPRAAFPHITLRGQFCISRQNFCGKMIRDGCREGPIWWVGARRQGAVWGFCTTCRSGRLLRSPSRLLVERLVSGNLSGTGARVDLPGHVTQFLHFQIISHFPFRMNPIPVKIENGVKYANQKAPIPIAEQCLSELKTINVIGALRWL